MAFTDWIGGAVSGAAGGAAIGSAGGPPGAVIGAVIGGTLGGVASAAAASKARGADQAASEALQRIVDKIDAQWVSPKYDTGAQITPEEYKLIGQYLPEIASYVEEQRPQMISQSVSSQERQAQRDSLEKFRQMSETGEDSISKAKEAAAAYRANAAERQKRLQLIQQAASRGLGPESIIGAELGGAQQTSQQQEQEALQAAAEAQQRRMQALQQYSQLASQMQQQNLSTEEKNADIINRFNERISRSRNAYNQYRADQANQAQQANLGYTRGIAAANVDLQNKAQQANIQRGDEIATNLAREQNRKLEALSKPMGAVAESEGQAARNDAQRFGTGVQGAISALPMLGRIMELGSSTAKPAAPTPPTETGGSRLGLGVNSKYTPEEEISPILGSKRTY